MDLNDDPELVNPYANLRQPIAVESVESKADQEMSITDMPVAAKFPASVNKLAIEKKPSGCLVALAIICAGLLVSLAIIVDDSGRSDRRVIDDQEQLIDDGDQSSVSFDASECTLLVIADGGIVKDDVEYSETLDDDDFWIDWCGANVKDAESIGPEDKPAVAFLEANNLTPPIVALLNPKGHPVWVKPLPKGGTDQIKRWITDGK